MKRSALLLIAAISLAGCSSFKMGAACYLPHGQYGTCTVGPTPATPAAPASAVK